MLSWVLKKKGKGLLLSYLDGFWIESSKSEFDDFSNFSTLLNCVKDNISNSLQLHIFRLGAPVDYPLSLTIIEETHVAGAYS
jgi:hypothetical protein